MVTWNLGGGGGGVVVVVVVDMQRERLELGGR